jgi:indoleamine 2,3-dioxygenase
MIKYYEKTYTDGFFNVGKNHGFLPIKDPLAKLPETYSHLQKLIDDLHVFQSGGKGVLGTPNFIEQRVNSLPNYIELVKNETDTFILQALFRAYTFITSGYTLELAYQEFIKSGNYGKARNVLPINISEPLIEVSNKLQVYPWLDYHYAYSLGNYVKKDPIGSLDWKNLDMACKFTGTSDEIGFIMVHVYINELTPDLVGSVLDYGKTKSNEHLKLCANTMESINKRRRSMWTASKHERYNDFRIFIMGIKGNEGIFGDGLVYTGFFDNKPQKFRGQTGAQDSIIPMIDIFSGIVDYYPENELTTYLMDLRSY